MSTDPVGPAPGALPRGPFEDRPGHLLAEVDLTLEVTDTDGRRTSGRLVGTGHRLRLEVDDPAVVVAAAGRGATHQLGSRLVEAGVRGELHGPRGRVAMVDPGRTSRAGRLLAGSPHVILERSGWWSVVRALLPLRRALLLAAALSGVGAAVAAASSPRIRHLAASTTETTVPAQP